MTQASICILLAALFGFCWASGGGEPFCKRLVDSDESIMMQVAPARRQHYGVLADSHRLPDFDGIRDAASKVIEDITKSVVEPAVEALEFRFNASLSALMDKAENLQQVATKAKSRLPAEVAYSQDKVGTFVNVSTETLNEVLVSWNGITQVFKNISASAVQSVKQIGKQDVAEEVQAFFEVPIGAANIVSQALITCENKLRDFAREADVRPNASSDSFTTTAVGLQQPVGDLRVLIRESLATTLVNKTKFAAHALGHVIGRLASVVQESVPAGLFNATPYFVAVNDTVHEVFDIVEDSLADILQVLTESVDAVLDSFASFVSPYGLTFAISLWAGLQVL